MSVLNDSHYAPEQITFLYVHQAGEVILKLLIVIISEQQFQQELYLERDLISC